MPLYMNDSEDGLIKLEAIEENCLQLEAYLLKVEEYRQLCCQALDVIITVTLPMHQSKAISYKNYLQNVKVDSNKYLRLKEENPSLLE